MNKSVIKYGACILGALIGITLIARGMVCCNSLTVEYVVLDAGRFDAGIETHEKGDPDTHLHDTDSPITLGGVKHIIVFIGDGMQLEHEIAACRYLYGADDGLVFHSFDYKGWATTWSVSSYNENASNLELPLYDETSFDPSIGYDAWLGGERPYPLTIVPTQDDYFQQSYSTDSGAAITAMMTGQKTDNGNICWRAGDPEDGDIRTIAEKLKKQKELSVGIVSTVPFNHATPAGVMAHNTSRYDYSSGHSDAPFGSRKKSLAEEIIEKAKPNVVIGGGHKDWISGYITDELYDGLKASSKYVFVERVEGTDGATNLLEGATLAAAQGKKLWGLFGGSGGNFESPIPSDTPGKPSFLVNPANPTMAQSVTAALTVLSADPDGFFALFEQGDLDWANHANDYSRMIGCMNDLNNAVISAIAFIRRPGDDITWNNTLMIVTADHANSYMRLNNDMILQKGDLPRQRCRLFSPKDDYPDGEVTYGTGSHTNELVTVYAKGAGTELFSKYEGNWYPKTRIIDNTNIYDIIKELTGVE